MSRNHIPWTRQEFDLLEEHYRQGGSEAAQAALPHRSPNSIKGAIQRLNLRMTTRGPYQKHPPDESIDQEIRRAYQQLHHGHRGIIRQTAERLGVHPGWLRWRAINLGVIKPKTHLFWSAEEDALVRDHIELGLKAVQMVLKRHGYPRSQSAILSRKQTLRITDQHHPDLMTASGVARLLGKNSKTVCTWIRTLGLPAKRWRQYVPSDEPGEPQNWGIHRDDLRRWLRDNPTRWDVHACQDHFWLVELLAGPPASATQSPNDP